MLKIFPILLFVSIVFSAEKTFFFLPPDTKSWFDSSPIIVENGDRQSFKEMLADTLHWFRYSWDEDSLPDSILIYRDSDSLFSEPIGAQGFPSEIAVQIPLKSLFEDSREGVISFIPEEEMRPDEDAYGFYTSDIRLRSYLGSFKSDLTVFVLVPDYKDWIEEIPVLVDVKDSRDAWELVPDDSAFAGWFRFHFSKEEYRPAWFYLYKKSDTLRKAPIGKNGYALGETPLWPLGGRGEEDSIFIVPDLNYDCLPEGEFLAGQGIVYENDARQVCTLQYNCLKPDFNPGCSHINFSPSPVYYSIFSADSELVKPDEPLLSQKSCVWGIFVPGCNEKIFMENEYCQLDAGNYLVKIHVENLDSAFFVPYTVASTALPFPDFRNKVDVIAENSFVWISSAASERYFVLNALGQVLARGKVLGSVKVEIPTAGNYWVRVGSETHFVRIRGK